MAEELRSRRGIAQDKLLDLGCELVDESPDPLFDVGSWVAKQVDPETVLQGEILAFGMLPDKSVKWVIEWQDKTTGIVDGPLVFGPMFCVGDEFIVRRPQGGEELVRVSAHKYSSALKEWTYCLSEDIGTGEYITQHALHISIKDRVHKYQFDEQSES